MENANSDSNPTLELSNATLNLTSAMALSPGPHTSSFQCPICEKNFKSGSDVEVHVNVDHRDILSPQKNVSDVSLIYLLYEFNFIC